MLTANQVRTNGSDASTSGAAGEPEPQSDKPIALSIRPATRRRSRKSQPPAQGTINLAAAPWVQEIKRAYAARRTDALSLGRIVFAARRQLKRGMFSAMADSGALPLAKRTLEMWSLIGHILGDLDADDSWQSWAIESEGLK